MAATETALAVTLLPHFITDASWAILDGLLQHWLHHRSHAIATVSWRRHVFDGETEGTATDAQKTTTSVVQEALRETVTAGKEGKRNSCSEDQPQTVQVTLTRCQVDDLPDYFRTL
jgi:hypothetical protein